MPSSPPGALGVLATLGACLTAAPPPKQDPDGDDDAEGPPAGLDEQLGATCDAAAAVAGVVLLQAGFQAWYAHHVAGADAREAAAALSVPQLYAVALQICRIKPHAAVGEHLRRLFYGSDRADQRRRLLQAAGFAVPGQNQPDASQPGPGASSATPVPPRGLPVPQLGPTPVSRAPGIQASLSSMQPTRPRNLPWAKQLPSVFPHFIYRSIVIVDYKAEVEISPPSGPRTQGPVLFLRLSIQPKKVTYLARELFDVAIEFENGQVCLNFDSGAISRMPSMRITGGLRHDVLDRFFGPEVAAAVRRSRRFSQELARGETKTDCASFSIAMNSGTCTSFLYLEADMESMSKISTKLFSPF